MNKDPVPTQVKQKKSEKSLETISRNEQKSRKCPIECFTEEKDGKTKLSIKNVENDNENLLQALTGTPNTELAMSIINSGVTALPKSMSEASRHNLIMQTLADSRPRDAHEAMLSSQAAVLYTQGMDFLERARRVLFDDEETFAKDHWHTILMKTATKLLDSHTKSVEALMRYRQKGEQRIVVQHVTVQDGGKAIVGNLIGGGGSEKK